jgi:uncharacterized RDD family membrane protein YckC
MTDSELQQKRLIAAAIDVAIAIAIGVAFGIATFAIGIVAGRSAGGMGGSIVVRIVGFLNAIVSLGYCLGRDILAGDRSLGKKIQNIRVVSSGGGAIGLMDSVNRNLIFGIGGILGLLSATLGLLPCLGDAVRCLLFPLLMLGFFVQIAVAIVEVVKIFQDPAGVRFGDQFAGTRVVR